MSEQEGAWHSVKCVGGGLAVHKCNKEKAMEYGATGGASGPHWCLSGKH